MLTLQMISSNEFQDTNQVWQTLYLTTATFCLSRSDSELSSEHRSKFVPVTV